MATSQCFSGKDVQNDDVFLTKTKTHPFFIIAIFLWTWSWSSQKVPPDLFFPLQESLQSTSMSAPAPLARRCPHTAEMTRSEPEANLSSVRTVPKNFPLHCRRTTLTSTRPLPECPPWILIPCPSSAAWPLRLLGHCATGRGTNWGGASQMPPPLRATSKALRSLEKVRRSPSPAKEITSSCSVFNICLTSTSHASSPWQRRRAKLGRQTGKSPERLTDIAAHAV